MTRTAIRNAALVGLTALLLAGLLLADVWAYPGDVMQVAQPAQPRFKGTAQDQVEQGHGVSADGAATYGIPVTVPPGRHGLSPTLSLGYSSRQPLRGEVAAQWALGGLPAIVLDTSEGRLGEATYASTLSGGRLVPVIEPGLATVDRYRAEYDQSYARYERFEPGMGPRGARWRVLLPSGITYYFGEDPEDGEPRSCDDPDDPAVLHAADAEYGRCFVSRIEDRFGNEVVFHYRRIWGDAYGGQTTGGVVDIAPDRIEYGGHADPAQDLSPVLLVQFRYNGAHTLSDPSDDGSDQCIYSDIPVGAQFSMRTGFRVYEGAARLDAIESYVKSDGDWRLRRQMVLEYDQQELDCSASVTLAKLRAPLRILTAVRETAWNEAGEETSLPPTTFAYGRPGADGKDDRTRQFTKVIGSVALSGNGLAAISKGSHALDPSKSGGWPNLDSMMLDVDGDGMLDVVRSSPAASDVGQCSVEWKRNEGGGQFGSWTAGSFPALPWAGDKGDSNGRIRNDSTDASEREGCSLSAQFSRRTNKSFAESDGCGYPANYTSYRMMAVTADGCPDIVMALDYQHGRYDPAADSALASYGDLGAADLEGACLDANDKRIVCDSEALVAPKLEQGDDTGGECGFEECKAPCCTGISCACSSVYCGETCPVTSEWEPAGDPGSPWQGPWFGPGDIGDELVPPGLDTGEPNCFQNKEMHGGRYVWRIYESQCDGTWSSEPKVHLSPIPLESTRPTSRLGARDLAAASSWHGFADIDGDGYTDAIWMQISGGDIGRFFVWRGQMVAQPGGGEAFAFVGRASGDPYLWSAPGLSTTDSGYPVVPRVTLSKSAGVTGVPWGRRTTDTEVTLRDINGDGLADYIDCRQLFDEDDGCRVFYNTGTGFETDAGTGTRLHSTLPTLERNEQIALDEYGNGHVKFGYSRNIYRLGDVDGDGLLDVTELPKADKGQRNPWQVPSGADGEPTLYINVGDQLIEVLGDDRLKNWLPALGDISVVQGDAWASWTGLVDTDGDGLSEVWNNIYGSGGYIPGVAPPGCTPAAGVSSYGPLCGNDTTVLTDPPDGHTLHSLRRVTTGAGGTIEYRYTPATNEAVVLPSDPDRRRPPFAVWVVSSMTTNPSVTADGSPAPDSVTRYRYQDPVYHRDHRGDYRFVGYEKTRVESARGSARESTHECDTFWRCLEAEEVLYEDASDLSAAHTVTRTGWEAKDLFGGQGAGGITVYHPSTVHSYLCRDGESVEACTDGSNDTVRFTEAALRGLVPTGTSEIVAWVPDWQKEHQALLPRQGDRYAVYGFDLAWGPNDYRLLLKGEDTYTMNASLQYEATGKTVRHYDTHNCVLTDVDTNVDAGTAARTHFVYDSSGAACSGTGNLLSRQKPEQVASGGPSASYTYDAAALYVQTTTSELGHVVETRYDAATGGLLETIGPNILESGEKGCQVAGKPCKELSVLVRDGFGRVTATYVLVDGAGGTNLEPVGRVTYDDHSFQNTSKPVAVHIKSCIEFPCDQASSRFVLTTDEVDGLGRLIRQQVANPDPAVPDAVKTIRYDAAGEAVAFAVPSTVTDGQLVTYEQRFDNLGRRTALVRPDGVEEQTDYGYLVETITEAPRDGSPAAKKEVFYDVRGRITVVREYDGQGAGEQWSTTRYGYDAQNRVTRIEALSAPNLPVTAVAVPTVDRITVLNHDWHGRRTDIIRGDRTWSYRYDLNGNLVTAVTPHNGGDPLPYTVTNTYDALDRQETSLAGDRALSGELVAAFGPSLIQTSWDTAVHGIGRIDKVVRPYGTERYVYDERGNAVEQERTVDVTWAGQWTLSEARTLYANYNAMGQLQTLWHGDAATKAEMTRVDYGYDDQGLPQTLSWDIPTMNVVGQMDVRRLAGGHIVERTHTDIDTGTAHRQVWTYDLLGRIDTLTVEHSPSGLGWVETAFQDYDYYRMSDPSQILTHVAGLADHQLTATYDDKHQILSATGSRGYNATFTYKVDGRVQSAHVHTGAAELPQVHAREVEHVYGGTAPDLEALEKLVRTDDTTHAEYEYDRAGNVTRRASDKDVWTFQYDGRNHQVEARKHDSGGSLEKRELYWYADTARELTLELDDAGQLVKWRWYLGDTEIHFDANAVESQTETRMSLAGSAVKIRDRLDVSLLYTTPLHHLLAATGTDGTLRAGFTYGPYGEILARTGSDSEDYTRLFNGKETDPASGMAYYGARYYDELALAWTQADPLYRIAPDLKRTQPRRAVLYGFSLNNPLRYYDPDGLDGEEQERKPTRRLGDSEPFLKDPKAWCDKKSDCKIAGKTTPFVEERADGVKVMVVGVYYTHDNRKLELSIAIEDNREDKSGDWDTGWLDGEGKDMKSVEGTTEACDSSVCISEEDEAAIQGASIVASLVGGALSGLAKKVLGRWIRKRVAKPNAPELPPGNPAPRGKTPQVQRGRAWDAKELDPKSPHNPRTPGREVEVQWTRDANRHRRHMPERLRREGVREKRIELGRPPDQDTPGTLVERNKKRR